MIQIRSTSHQDGEATVIKANRKHQIVLNMEVKRIEMEKKMRERYFFFEMSLIKARRLKIIDRQKSLGIYRPHMMEHGRDSRKERRMNSIFFTKSLMPLDSKVKLPPVERSRAVPEYPVKLTNTGNYFKATELSKNINQKKLFNMKKLRQSEEGNGQPRIGEPFKSTERDSIDEGTWEKSEKNRRSTEVSSEDLSIPNDRSHNKNSQEDSINHRDSRSKCYEAKEKKHCIEEKGLSRKQSSLPSPEETNLSPEGNVTLPQNTKDIAKMQTLSETTGKIQTEICSLSIHDITEFPSYQELRAWRDNFERARFNFAQGSRVFGRLKSASAAENGKHIKVKQAHVHEVRPQSALAKLTQE